MVSKPRKELAPETEAQIPQSTPSMTGYPGRDFDYTLQCVFELKQSFGSIDTKLDAMKSSIDGLKGKVDDLVGWKNKILGGVAVLVAVIAVLGFLAGKASEYVSFSLKPAPLSPSATANPAPTVEPATPVTAPAKPPAKATPPKVAPQNSN